MLDRIPRKPLTALMLVVVFGCLVYVSLLGNVHYEKYRAEGLANQYKERVETLEQKISELKEADEGKRALLQRMNDDIIKTMVSSKEQEKIEKRSEDERTQEIMQAVERQCSVEMEKERNNHDRDLSRMKEIIKSLQQTPAVQEEQVGFVTLVTNNFWKQGVALVQSARDHGVVHPFVVMAVDPDGISPSAENFTKLPIEAERAFRRLNAEVRYIEPVPVPAEAQFENPRWSIAWNKLRAYQFTEFSKLVFLDSDMIVMRDITEMLTFPDFSSAPGHTEPCETHHGINGGVLIFSPNNKTYSELMAFAENPPSSKWRQAEQELLGHFYLTFYKQKFHLISGLYNISLRSCQCLPPIVLADHVKVIHFYSGNKPWDYTQEQWANPSSLNIDHPCIADLALVWYATLSRAMSGLTS